MIKSLKISHWIKETAYETFEIEILDKNIEANIVIVGSGVLGRKCGYSVRNAVIIKESKEMSEHKLCFVDDASAKFAPTVIKDK